MWEHELPLSKTPIPAARDSIVRPATRVTRLMALDCSGIATIEIDDGTDFPSHDSFTRVSLDLTQRGGDTFIL